MKIYIYSTDIDCGGNMANLHRAALKYIPNCQCKMSVKNKSAWAYETDLVDPPEKKVIDLLSWADIIIIHGFPYNLCSNVNWKELSKHKKLYFWDMCNWEMDKCMNEDFKAGRLEHILLPFKNVITFAPAHIGLFKNGVWLPPIVNTDSELLKPDTTRSFGGELIIVQSPSGTDKNSKELEDTVKELIAEGYKLKLNILRSLSHSQCLAEKRKGHILFDNIRQGWWGQSGYEGLAQGLAVFAKVDKTTEEAFAEIYGKCPVININNMDQFKAKIIELVTNRDKLRAICDDNAKFMHEEFNIESNAKLWHTFLKEDKLKWRNIKYKQ